MSIHPLSTSQLSDNCFSADPSIHSGCCLTGTPHGPKYYLQKSWLKSLQTKDFRSNLDKGALDLLRGVVGQALQNSSMEVERISLEKDGIYYDAIAVKPDGESRDWCLFVQNEGAPMEMHLEDLAYRCQDLGLNLLILNGPGQGRSEGSIKKKTFGKATEAAIQYLEQEAKANKIAFLADGLGATKLCAALASHFFPPNSPIYLGARVNAPASQDRHFHGCGKWMARRLNLKQDQTELTQIFKQHLVHEIIAEPCLLSYPSGYMRTPETQDLVGQSPFKSKDRLAFQLVEDSQPNQHFVGTAMMSPDWSKQVGYWKGRVLHQLMLHFHEEKKAGSSDLLWIAKELPEIVYNWLSDLNVDKLSSEHTLWEGLAESFLEVYDKASLPDRKSFPEFLPAARALIFSQLVAKEWQKGEDIGTFLPRLKSQCKWTDFGTQDEEAIRQICFDHDFSQKLFTVIKGILATDEKPS